MITEALLLEALNHDCRDANDEICQLSYETDEQSSTNDLNFCSEIRRIKATFQRRNGRQSKKVLLLKIPYTVPAYDIFQQSGMYEKESIMYNRVLPLISKLLNRYITAPSYRSTDYPLIIILDDLKQFGYKTADRIEQLDFDHCAAALKTLATFHAATYYVNETTPDVLEKVKNEFFYCEDYYRSMIQTGIRNMARSLTDTVHDGGKELAAKLLTMTDRLIRDFPKLIGQANNKTVDRLNVLNHGDYWTCNMLFKYDDYRIADVRMIDFQTCRWCPPAVDLIYFLTVAAKFDVYKTHYDDLLRIYVDQFNRTTLIDLNCRENPLTVDELKRSIDEHRDLYVVFVCCFLNMMLTDRKDQPTFQKNKDDGQSIDYEALSYTYYGRKFQDAAVLRLKYFDSRGYFDSVR